MWSARSAVFGLSTVPITLGTNIASLKASRKLSQSTNQLSSVFERLSSGQRINRAADDAAGLAVSSSLNAKTRVFNQAIRNLNDGVSALNIADGAVSQLSQIITRQRELAEQSANGIYNTAQRSVMDGEAQSLAQEYSRILQTTSFNNIKLLDGTSAGINLQGGYGANGALAVQYFDSTTTAGSTTDAGTVTTYTLAANGPGYDQLANTRFLFGDLNNDGRVDIVALSVAGDNGTMETAEARMSIYLGKAGGGYTTADATAATTWNAPIEIWAGGGISGNLADIGADGDVDIRARFTGFFDLGSNFAENETFTNLTIQNGGVFTMDTAFNDAPANPTDQTTAGGLSNRDLNGDGFNDDIYSNFDGTFTVRIHNTTTTAGSTVIDGLDQTAISLTSAASARTALTDLKTLSTEVSRVQSRIGASLSRLESASNVLGVSATNFAAAEGRIKDADMADESSNLIRLKIMQQTASAVMAQANLIPEIAIKLLKS